jgi:hypothetical protein
LTFERSAAQAIVNDAGAGGALALHYLSRMNLQMDFVLDVAASTSDSSNGADGNIFAEARGNWSFNGSGLVGPRGDQLTAASFPWTGSVTLPILGGVSVPLAGVTAPTAWTMLPIQVLENMGQPIFNIAAVNGTFQ